MLTNQRLSDQHSPTQLTAVLLVGWAAVGGGRFAHRTARFWPPANRVRWRHRSAACTSAAVTILVGGVFVWAVAAGSDPSLEKAGFPMSLIVLVVIATVSYLYSYVLASVAHPIVEDAAIQTQE
ncbi:hypothetical protein E5720_17480 [Rhodococcus sp. PAMC28707]|uniref:hypothetical protein n=1 Tax=unclassified Rhodococcus (in: high G+C Gram-positive bacteria) TaxID=192944 RepID=UPI00109E282C|nr:MULTISPECIES: hypothetical protein [unclassified Rhodococcus (in: high G+C Gram-positive bacteria)]QCB51820.1 hypothetical protein E5769_18040 [Rhodococcus sp. PAMC28705]QCB60011.1 hypothetical protein E5720_17480 [Rhodococcus sp. PAMC28707]